VAEDSAAHCNAVFFPPVVVASGYFGYVRCTWLLLVLIDLSNDYDGRTTHNRTPTPARTFKAATTNNPNKTKSNHVQPKDTQMKIMLIHITKTNQRQLQ
jgi:hypothetical protein